MPTACFVRAPLSCFEASAVARTATAGPRIPFFRSSPMKTCLRRALVSSLGRVFGLVAAVALAAGAAHAVAQDIVKVEEDWEMVLGSPDAATCGPPVVITI